jgi:hypothetical protein
MFEPSHMQVEAFWGKDYGLNKRVGFLDEQKERPSWRQIRVDYLYNRMKAKQHPFKQNFKHPTEKSRKFIEKSGLLQYFDQEKEFAPVHLYTENDANPENVDTSTLFI